MSPEEPLQEPLLSPETAEVAHPLTSEAPTSPISRDIIIPHCCRSGSLFQMNHNVFLNLILAFLAGISDSLWAGTVLVAYLKLMGHDENSPVGDIEAVNGLATLLSALPVGYLADKYGRAKVIAYGGIGMLLTAALHLSLVLWIGTNVEQQRHWELWAMAVVMALWGVVAGVTNGPAQALFADSTPQGLRSQYYVYLFIVYLVASAVGPTVSIVMFQTIGDEWDLRDLRNVLFVGLGVTVLEAIVMLFFDDAKALEEETHDSRHPTTPPNETATNPLPAEEAPVEPQTSTLDNTHEGSSPYSGVRRIIPYVLFGHGLIMAIGSGMTVKFFPLFFKEDVGLSPSQVQVIYVLVPLVMAAFSTVGTNVAAAGLGRVQTVMLFQTCGISLLVSMVVFSHYLDRHPFILVPIYILRTALMNAIYPLEESILMDFVPKNTRARWKSLESVAAFGWCGSAALGGWMADEYDYSRTFAVTAAIQTLGMASMGILLPLVPRAERHGADSREEEEEDIDPTSGPVVVEEATSPLEQPLLEESTNRPSHRH